MILRLLDQQITNDAAQHGRRRCSTSDLENRRHGDAFLLTPVAAVALHRGAFKE